MAETLLHVLGTRADFAKAAPVVRALADAGVPQDVVHTGHHDDAVATDVFFAAHGLPTPLVDLGVGPASPGRQTGLLLSGLEDVVAGHEPALVVAYGDGNAALATALTCAKAPVPFAHVEAGMRAGDRGSAEEVNRVVVDSLAALHLATSADAVGHLTAEGADPAHVHLVGNPLVEGLRAALPQLDPVPVRVRPLPARYAVATLDRPGDVDDREAAGALAAAVEALSEVVPVVVVLPRRARRRLAAAGLTGSDRLTVTDPLPYHEHLAVLRGAAVVVTDAGAVQDETTALGVPCLTVRPRTERPVTVTHGTNRLTGPDRLAAAAAELLADEGPGSSAAAPPLWDGKAASRIAALLTEWHAAARLSGRPSRPGGREMALTCGSPAGRTARPGAAPRPPGGPGTGAPARRVHANVP